MKEWESSGKHGGPLNEHTGLGRISKMIKDNPGIVLGTGREVRECVDKLICVTHTFTLDELKHLLSSGDVTFLHGEKPSRPAAALYVSLSHNYHRKCPENSKLQEVLELLRTLKGRLPGWATEGGGPSVLIYINKKSMDELKQHAEDSNLRVAPYIADGVCQGIHLDTGLFSMGVGSLLWATKGSPWTKVFNMTPKKVKEFVWEQHRIGVSKDECVARLMNHLENLESKKPSELKERNVAGGGNHALLFNGQFPHQGVGYEDTTCSAVVGRVATRSTALEYAELQGYRHKTELEKTAFKDSEAVLDLPDLVQEAYRIYRKYDVKKSDLGKPKRLNERMSKTPKKKKKKRN